VTDLEVHIDLRGSAKRVGTLFRYASANGESIAFAYHNDWLTDPEHFPIEPALVLQEGIQSPANEHQMFGSMGDATPDTWGRNLMRRAEWHRAKHEGRAVRFLAEAGYLLGVSDAFRQGALRFRKLGTATFEATLTHRVPRSIDLSRLVAMAERLVLGEDAEDDLHTVLALGGCLGGARPKVSMIDRSGFLSIAKLPKPGDPYNVERWEAVALRLARMAGISVADHQLLDVGGRSVLLSRRFDRDGASRIPFLSGLSLVGQKDGERGSYPELVDGLFRHGAHASRDAAELYRRMAFNVLISNVDDHLRNHGFLRLGSNGWELSPAFDFNPTPADLKDHILSTNIDLNAGPCNLDLVLSVAEFFDLSSAAARGIVKTVAEAARSWREVAVSLGAKAPEIRRMESAFEHERLTRALAL
jgi:serine/threonine-protein kinase HipA